MRSRNARKFGSAVRSSVRARALQLVGHPVERDAELRDLVIAGDRRARVRSPAAMRSAACDKLFERPDDIAQASPARPRN